MAISFILVAERGVFMLTKKRMAVLTVLMTVIYFIPMLFLPESIIGSRAEHMVIFAFKIAFLSMTAAITTAFILLFVFKRDYINVQIATFKRFRHLIRMMVRRDFVSRYRKSVLGVLWSLLNPLLTMLVMTMVFSYIFARQIENFPVYLLSGQIIFGFFSESTNQAMGSVISSGAIIRKVYVPKYIFPLVRIISSLVNLMFSFIAFLIVFLVTRAPFHWTMMLIPIPIIYVFVFSLGIGLLLSSLSVFFRDLSYLYGIFLTLLMYLTPLFYPVEILPARLLPFMGFNPMYQFIDYFRNLVLHGTIPGLWTNAVCIGFSLGALCFGTYSFMSKQDKYILYI
jgi:ABC-type polysaccharide/polyol phosphate export permease